MASPIKMNAMNKKKPVKKASPMAKKAMAKKAMAQGDENQREAFNAYRGLGRTGGGATPKVSKAAAKSPRQLPKSKKDTSMTVPKTMANIRRMQRSGGKGK
jgi:hypothetical protein